MEIKVFNNNVEKALKVAKEKVGGRRIVPRTEAPPVL